jgi:hypothetical protein
VRVDAVGGTALADGHHGGHGDMVMRCEMVDECALTWTIGGVEMSPEAHCAAAASLLDREGAKQEHVVAVLHAWRSTAAHRWHVINALRSARWWAPSAKASTAISALLEVLGAADLRRK